MGLLLLSALATFSCNNRLEKGEADSSEQTLNTQGSNSENGGEAIDYRGETAKDTVRDTATVGPVAPRKNVPK